VRYAMTLARSEAEIDRKWSTDAIDYCGPSRPGDNAISGLARPLKFRALAKCRGRNETPRIHLASWDLRDMGDHS